MKQLEPLSGLHQQTHDRLRAAGVSAVQSAALDGYITSKQEVEEMEEMEEIEEKRMRRGAERERMRCERGEEGMSGSFDEN